MRTDPSKIGGDISHATKVGDTNTEVPWFMVFIRTTRAPRSAVVLLASELQVTLLGP